MGKTETTAVVGYFMFDENLTLIHILGIGLVIFSVILINVRIRSYYLKRYGKYVSPLVKFGMAPLKMLKP